MYEFRKPSSTRSEMNEMMVFKCPSKDFLDCMEEDNVNLWFANYFALASGKVELTKAVQYIS